MFKRKVKFHRLYIRKDTDPKDPFNKVYVIGYFPDLKMYYTSKGNLTEGYILEEFKLAEHTYGDAIEDANEAINNCIEEIIKEIKTIIKK